MAAGLEPILLVIHVYREASDGEEIVRIISARKAGKSVQNDILTWLQSKGPGHLSRINAILANVMDAEQ